MNKLLELQKRLKPIKKDSVNPHFKNSYFDINSVLEVVMPILNDLGLTLHQPIVVDNGKNLIKTVIQDDMTDLLESYIALPDLQDPQKLGSCITYYRRYSLVSLLALEAEDDDANVASGHTQASTPKKTQAPAQDKIKFNEELHQKVSMPSMEKEVFKETARKFEALGGGYEKGFFLPTKLAEEYRAKHEAKTEEYPFDIESSQEAIEQ